MRIVSTSGNIKNAAALLDPKGGQAATFTREAADAGPTAVVLDYGMETGGIPVFEISRVSGSPQLRASYSEYLQYADQDGDHGGTHSADPLRCDTYTLVRPGTITNTYVQGGERYQVIALTSPGSFSLRAVRIRRTHFMAKPEQYRGHFLSSDKTLNKIWYASAYTLQTNMLPPGGNVAPAAWKIGKGFLETTGVVDGAGLLRAGRDWKDYTISFKTRIRNGRASWLLRSADPEHGYIVSLGLDGHIEASAHEFDKNHLVARKDNVGFSIRRGQWYTVQSVVKGPAVSVSIDGAEVLAFSSESFSSGVPSFNAGSFGFRQLPGEDADFAHLRIIGVGGKTLYQTELDTLRSLGSFDLPLYNSIPVIVDGAKRDRSVWSGDLAVQGPVDYYSVFATDYMQKSLELLGSNVNPDGRVSTNLHVEWPIYHGDTGSPYVRTYSANYTLWWVLDLADYYLYTGDRNFILKQWPILSKEMTWASGQLNRDGLFATNKENGLDWDYYDGPKEGAVTAFNALYYRALIVSSELASAIGELSQARQYQSNAEKIRTAMNKRLFNAATGVYDVSDEERGTLAQDANVFPIVFGVAPADKTAAILATLKADLWTTRGPRPFLPNRYKPTISPFISGFELMARFGAGDDADAFDLLEQLWGPMINPRSDATATVWENVSLDGEPGLGRNTSLSHGWSAMPAVALSGEVLGIKPLTPGYSQWAIKPHPGNLVWAEGSTATPKGEIRVNWSHAQRSSRFVLHISTPAGTFGQVSVPTFQDRARIFVDNRLAWDGVAVNGFAAERENGYVVIKRMSGTRLIVSTHSLR